MPAARISETCLVTAATERFVPGAVVTLGTFLKHHPRFDGDIVVVHDGLEASAIRHLLDVCPQLRLEAVAPELRRRLRALTAARPDFAARLGQFYSLEAFRLTGYRKVLYYDSDVLFQAPVDDLFDATAALVCCGDNVHLRGWHRDRATYAPHPPPAPADALERTFGAGFLLIDRQVIDDGAYDALLAWVTPETWRDTSTTHTDQLVLNRCFGGRQTLVSRAYDFVVSQAADIQAREGVDAASAKVLHFAGPVKPWMPTAMLRWTSGDPRFKPALAFRAWWSAYIDCLAAAHMRGVQAKLGRR